MQIQPENIRAAFQAFDWKTLFLEELLWSKPRPVQPPVVAQGKVREVAHLGQIPVYEITSGEAIPDTPARREIHLQISKTTGDCLLIFMDASRTQTVWLWAKREKSRFVYRESVFVQGQNGDLFLSKIAALFVDIEAQAGSTPVSALQAGKLLSNALDVSKITKKFYLEFKEVQLEIAPLIEGLPDAKTRARYTLVLLHRLMFIYFLQKRGFIDDDVFYLENKLEKFGDGKNGFFEAFLKPLFFEGFAKPERDAQLLKLIGDVPYLNGGLFLQHPLEREYSVGVPDAVFEKILGVFKQYDWYASDDRDTARGLLSPELLGFIFEKFINDQKSAGAYYTPEALTSYLCERTIEDLILDEVKIFAGTHARRAESVFDLIGHADKKLCLAVWERLSSLKVLDPAVGSGAFLVAAFYTLDQIYTQLWSRADALHFHELKHSMMGDDAAHANHLYALRRRIITQNLYGVDLMEGAPEIARLRLFLALVSSVDKKSELEPLPNIDFNILEGNSLIGMTACDEKDFVGGGLWVKKEFDELARKKTVLIETYKKADDSIRAQLGKLQRDANDVRDQLKEICDAATVAHWNALGIRREGQSVGGKKTKIGIGENDIAALRPFHWGAEFPDVMKSGGFDAIITNPPWEIWKPNAKEFFQTYSNLVTKKKMTIKEFEDKQKELLKDPEIAAAWNDYLGQFPHVSEYFRSAPEYSNQISLVNGKKAGTDINLYKLFVERCMNLLHENGRCGIVIPSGIYTDLGAKQLREMLFGSTLVTGVFGFENRKEIFEGVHRSFKFVALTWRKGGSTPAFPAAFMRHDVNELAAFPSRESLQISVELVRRLSPDSLSVMEFKSEKDVEIAEKMLTFPLLGEKIEGVWNLSLTREFDMTNDSHLFKTSDAKGRVALYQGGMIHQFDATFGKGTYWVNEKEGRAGIIGRNGKDTKQKLDYQSARFGFRAIARNTDSRTIIVGPIPPNVFCGNSLLINRTPDVGRNFTGAELLYLQAVANSFALDYFMRLVVTANINMFYIYQLPVPRLTSGAEYSDAIVTRAAQLICTTPEFDELAKAAGLGSHHKGVADEGQRGVLRAELDALVARLYGLDEGEFDHILGTFPLVAEPIKLAARNKFRDLNRGVWIP